MPEPRQIFSRARTRATADLVRWLIKGALSDTPSMITLHPG
jgi:hypothetical protein